MLPLESFVNTLQNALRDSDCLVGALASLDRRLKHHDAWLVLKDPADRLNIEIPECCQLSGGIVALGCHWLLRRIARLRQRFVHYSAPRFGVRSGTGLAGRYFKLSDSRSLYAT